MRIVRLRILWWGAAAITIFPWIIVDPQVGLESVLDHEAVHWDQQRRWAIYGLGVGLLVWWFLYLFALPIGWNPWRARWECEAFRVNKYCDSAIIAILRRRPYFLWRVRLP